MSRVGRGGSRGGGSGAGGGFGRGRRVVPPPMGLTFADVQALPREGTALYPPYDSLPTVTDSTEAEKRVCELQLGFTTRLRKSPYYLVEPTKSTELPRYSDRYRPSPASQPTLKRKDLHAPFFPSEIFEDYFNPKRRRKPEKKPVTKKMNLDEMNEDDDGQDKSLDEQSEVGSEQQSDYDVEEEYDNDYAENYFDNGEGDDLDDLGGGGGGGGEDYGGGDYE